MYSLKELIRAFAIGFCLMGGDCVMAAVLFVIP
jgi:hypothetical protein